MNTKVYVLVGDKITQFTNYIDSKVQSVSDYWQEDWRNKWGQIDK